MAKEHTHPGRILRHGARADEITAGAIETRAQELAVIDGRSPDEVTDEDRARSRSELQGDLLPETTLDDADGAALASGDPRDPVAGFGVRSPTRNDPTEQEIQERLALEGVEEAQHDQMLAARRRRSS